MKRKRGEVKRLSITQKMNPRSNSKLNYNLGVCDFINQLKTTGILYFMSAIYIL